MTDHADDGPSLVGARIGNLQVIAKTKPGRRVQYLVEHGPTGRRTAERGSHARPEPTGSWSACPPRRGETKGRPHMDESPCTHPDAALTEQAEGVWDCHGGCTPDDQ